MKQQFNAIFKLFMRKLPFIKKQKKVINEVDMEYALICRESAIKYNVISDIHPNDFMFHYIINPSNAFKEVNDGIRYYFDDGYRSAEKLSSVIADIYGDKDLPIQLLEFASGYGCVTRHLKRHLPNVSVTSCDIHDEAVDFISNKIGIPAFISHSLPEKLDLPRDYDVIFALSFFTHMPITTWGRWLRVLKSKLNKGGFLIFTTHGNESRKYVNYPEIDQSGFWFNPQSEQKDIDTSDYGGTIALPTFVFNEIYKEKDARIILFREAYWWGHQDLYVLKRFQ